MTNNINANTDIKEILKQVSVRGLFDVELTKQEEELALLGAMATPFGTYYIESSKGKSSGCDTQVDQAVAVETSHGVTTEAIKACNDLKGTVKLEGACDKKVSSSLFTPDGSPQNIDEVERKGRS